jgi:hypothetical protein
VFGAAIFVVVLVGAGCRPVKPPNPRPAVAIFPTDSLTAPDAAQATGKRVNLPLPSDCVAFKSECDEIALLNQLDGFDLDPTITLGFDSPIDVARVTDASVFLEPVAGGSRIGLNRLVWDATSNTLLGHPRQQLTEATEYRITVMPSVNGQSGTATFTTMSATVQLGQMRAQLDDGSAYTDAGITDRSLHLDVDSANNPAVYAGAGINGSLSPGTAGTRTNDVGSGNTTSEQLFSSMFPGDAGFVAFGSFESPSWLDGNRRIPPTPTGTGEPAVTGKETVGFVVVTPPTPACTKPASGWPVAIFGPGFTRSKYDLFLASDETLNRCMATIAIDPVGHAYGPGSTVTLNLLLPPSQVTITVHGRGSDRDGDGDIEADEGVGTLGQPNPYASIALRDGLRQTAADNMALLRAVGQSGLDLDGGGNDLAGSNIKYFGQSFGAIYGTMLVATDTRLGVGALNVGGGPILDIARLSPTFRDRVGRELKNRQPPAFNGNPADDSSFQESQPLFLDPPVTNPAPGAVVIQQIGARVNWLNRSGSPEAFAPLLVGTKQVLYQFAFGDQTVSNPTNATLMRAGGLQAVTTLYRNDRTPTSACDPHGFLLDPRITGRQQGQIQVATFLAGGGITDPDAGGTVFETPIADPNSIETLNFSSLSCPFDEIGVP